jgi:hypothetical protein
MTSANSQTPTDGGSVQYPKLPPRPFASIDAATYIAEPRWTTCIMELKGRGLAMLDLFAARSDSGTPHDFRSSGVHSIGVILRNATPGAGDVDALVRFEIEQGFCRPTR